MGNEFRRRIKTADDQDVHSAWRKVLGSLKRANAASRLKRRTRRRERREGKAVTRDGYER